jgi:hypothetical protein
VITGDYLQLLLIICRVIAIRKTIKTFFKELKHEKDGVKNLKSAQAAPNSSNLSFGTTCSHSQSRDTIPLTHTV